MRRLDAAPTESRNPAVVSTNNSRNGVSEPPCAQAFNGVRRRCRGAPFRRPTLGLGQRLNGGPLEPSAAPSRGWRPAKPRASPACGRLPHDSRLRRGRVEAAAEGLPTSLGEWSEAAARASRAAAAAVRGARRPTRTGVLGDGAEVDVRHAFFRHVLLWWSAGRARGAVRNGARAAAQ